MAIQTKDGFIDEGLVLDVWVGDYQIMSDVWGSARKALVWDTERQAPVVKYVDVCDYTWGGNDGKGYEATVDATPEVLAAYDNYKIEVQTDRQVAAMQEYNERVVNGATVEVVSGRQGKGTVGKVVFSMEGSYGMGYRAARMKKFCIATSDRVTQEINRAGKVYDKYVDTVWAWSINVKRLDVEQVNRDEVRAQVAQNYRRTFDRR